MRGAYAAGAVSGLYDAGLRYDAVYASSSGACTSAYLHAEQREGLAIWERHLSGGRLLRPINLARGRPYLDLDYLIDEVFARRVPLDLARLRAAPAPLWVTVTRARDGAVEYRDLRRAADPLRVLRASAALPIAYPTPVLLEDEAYIDGGIGDPIPVLRAIADGATDITVVLTKPLGYRREPAGAFLTWWGTRPYPTAARAFATVHERYNAALDAIARPPRGVTVRAIAPPADLHLKRLSSRAKVLRAAVARGMADGLNATRPRAASRP